MQFLSISFVSHEAKTSPFAVQNQKLDWMVLLEEIVLSVSKYLVTFDRLTRGR